MKKPQGELIFAVRAPSEDVAQTIVLEQFKLNRADLEREVTGMPRNIQSTDRSNTTAPPTYTCLLQCSLICLKLILKQNIMTQYLFSVFRLLAISLIAAGSMLADAPDSIGGVTLVFTIKTGNVGYGLAPSGVYHVKINQSGTTYNLIPISGPVAKSSGEVTSYQKTGDTTGQAAVTYPFDSTISLEYDFNFLTANTGTFSIILLGSTVQTGSFSITDGIPYIAAEPTSVAAYSGDLVTLKVKAAGVSKLEYQWFKDGSAIDGATSSTYSFTSTGTGDSGNYYCIARAGDHTTTSKDAAVSVVEPIHSIVGSTLSLPDSTVEGASSYSAKGLPPGVTINSKTGALSGVSTKSGAYTFSVITKTGTSTPISQTYRVSVAPLSAHVVGLYHGLIERNGELNGSLGSSFTFSTTTSGSCSGKIMSGSSVTAFTGQLNTSVDSPDQSTLTAAIPKLGTLELTLDGTADTLSGTLTGATTVANVTAWRNAWATIKGGAIAYKGTMTFRLENTEASLATPAGYGIGSVAIAPASGAAIISGVLADGQPITANSFVGQNGELQFYVPLYVGKGTLIGQTAIALGSNSPKDNGISGDLTWSKPATKDTVYSSGFGPITLGLKGSTYNPPATGTLIMGIEAKAQNATISFTSGGLDSTLSQSFTINTPGASNKASIPTNANKISISSFSTSTGAIGGGFTLTGATAALTRKVTYKGQFVTIDNETRGYGFFLLSQLPGENQTLSNAPKLSGSVNLEPVQ